MDQLWVSYIDTISLKVVLKFRKDVMVQFLVLDICLNNYFITVVFQCHYVLGIRFWIETANFHITNLNSTVYHVLYPLKYHS